MTDTEQPKQEQWSQERWDQAKTLERLIHTIQHLNSGSNFIGKVQECIEMAASLDTHDRPNKRYSFLYFLECLKNGDSIE